MDQGVEADFVAIVQTAAVGRSPAEGEVAWVPGF